MSCLQDFLQSIETNPEQCRNHFANLSDSDFDDLAHCLGLNLSFGLMETQRRSLRFQIIQDLTTSFGSSKCNRGGLICLAQGHGKTLSSLLGSLIHQRRFTSCSLSFPLDRPDEINGNLLVNEQLLQEKMPKALAKTVTKAAPIFANPKGSSKVSNAVMTKPKKTILLSNQESLSLLEEMEKQEREMEWGKRKQMSSSPPRKLVRATLFHQHDNFVNKETMIKEETQVQMEHLTTTTTTTIPPLDLNLNLKLEPVHFKNVKAEKILGKSTLVLCPKAVARSWYSEIIQKIPCKHVTVLWIQNHHQWVANFDGPSLLWKRNEPVSGISVTQSLIDECDFVICHFQFLTSSSWRTHVMDPIELFKSKQEKGEKDLEKSKIHLNDWKRVSPGLLWNPQTDDVRFTTEMSKKHVLYGHSWHTIIVDECHHARNPKSILAHLICALIGKRHWALSATPEMNSEGDMWTLWRFIRVPNLMTYRSFMHPSNRKIRLEFKSCYMDKTDAMEQSKQVFTDQQDQEWKQRGQMGIVSFWKGQEDDFEKNCTKSLPLPLEPPLNTNNPEHSAAAFWHTILVDMTDSERCLYETLGNNMMEKVSRMTRSDKYNTEWSCLMYLRQLCAHPLSLQPQALAKVNCEQELKQVKMEKKYGKADLVASLLESLLQNTTKKAVVFCHFVNGCLELQKVLAKTKTLKPLVLTGSTPDHDQKLDLFVSSPASVYNVLINTWTLSEGINLLTVANICLLLTPHWNRGREQQAYKRLHRPGQLSDVHVYQMLYRNTVEERISSIADRKIAESRLTSAQIHSLLCTEFGLEHDNDDDDLVDFSDGFYNNDHQNES